MSKFSINKNWFIFLVIFNGIIPLFSNVDDEKFGNICQQQAEEYTNTGDDYFQDQNFEEALKYYLKADDKYQESRQAEHFLYFRIDIGKEMSEAFVKNEYTTLERRLEKIYQKHFTIFFLTGG